MSRIVYLFVFLLLTVETKQQISIHSNVFLGLAVQKMVNNANTCKQE